MQALRNELQRTEAQTAQLRAQLREADDATAAAQRELTAIMADRDIQHGQAQQAKARVVEIERRLLTSQTQVSELQDRVVRHQHDSQAAQRNYAELQAEAGNLQRMTVELQAANRRLEDGLVSAQAQHEQLATTGQVIPKLEGQLMSASRDLEQVSSELAELRRQRDRLQQELLQSKSVNKREKDNHATIVADLERQLQVARARYDKEHSHVSSSDATTRQLRDEVARLQRALEASQQQLQQAEAQQLQTELALKERERALTTTKKRVETLTTETQRLAAQRKALEERTRRDQSRLLADVQSQLHAHDDAMQSVSRLRETSTLGQRTYDRRLAQLGSQVRQLGDELRHERVETEAGRSGYSSARVTPTPSGFELGSGLNGTAPLTSTLRAHEVTGSMPEGIEVLGDDE
jgi:chromosome segregation ATPase